MPARPRMASGPKPSPVALPILFVFVASRLVLLVVAAVVEATLPLAYQGQTFSHAPILTSLTGEDAVYYLGIAANGYHLAPIHDQFVDWVFFPAFPVATRIAAAAIGDVALAGVVVANAATLAALFLVFELTRREFDRETGLRAVGLVAFAPGAVAFGMAYSDSLLLAAVAGAMVAAYRRHDTLMAGLFVLAVLTRPPGILFGLPLAAVLWKRRRRPLDLGWLVAGPLALVGFSAYQCATLGDPFAFIDGQSRWNLAPAIGGGAPGAVAGIGSTVPLVALLYVGLLAYTLLLVLAYRDKLPIPDLLIAVVAFASVFVSGRLQSDLRYLVIGWPFAWVLARGSRLFGRDLSSLTLGGTYVLFAFLNLTQALAP